MKRLLDFKEFVNESFISNNLSFIFIPLDKDYKSLDTDIANSKTPLPSESIKAGTVGYALVPATVETDKLINSVYFNQPYEGITGRIGYTKKITQDGFIVMNGGKTPSTTGVASITAEIPGFSQSIAFYLTCGNSFIMESLMKKEGWEEMKIEDIGGRKIGNGFSQNKVMSCEFWGGIEEASGSIRVLLGAVSDNIGLSLDDELKEKYDITQDLLDLFKSRPGDFMSMNFSEEVFQKISELAKEQAPEENIAKTIDNLSDLKAGGLFDD
jgi:hypothetical protein